MRTRNKPTPEEKTSQTLSGECPKRRPASLAVYLVVLFSAAFLLLLLAYFMQARTAAPPDYLSSTSSWVESLGTENVSRETMDVVHDLLEVQ